MRAPAVDAWSVMFLALVVVLEVAQADLGTCRYIKNISACLNDGTGEVTLTLEAGTAECQPRITKPCHRRYVLRNNDP